jgi:hypothetical protein
VRRQSAIGLVKLLLKGINFHHLLVKSVHYKLSNRKTLLHYAETGLVIAVLAVVAVMVVHVRAKVKRKAVKVRHKLARIVLAVVVVLAVAHLVD